jgi:predicted TIM-barrel fold metal-dependent hydrolase
MKRLFAEYKNLYVDSTVGMYLRWADGFVEEDRLYLRDFIEAWGARILFGTDADMFPGCMDEYAAQSFLCHARFLLKLGLSHKTLQDVAWRNAQELLNLGPVSSARRGNTRP